MNDLRDSVMIVISGRDVVSVLCNTRKSVTHDGADMSSFEHGDIVLGIAGRDRIFNRNLKKVAHPPDGESLGDTGRNDLKIGSAGKKAVKNPGIGRLYVVAKRFQMGNVGLMNRQKLVRLLRQCFADIFDDLVGH